MAGWRRRNPERGLLESWGGDIHGPHGPELLRDCFRKESIAHTQCASHRVKTWYTRIMSAEENLAHGVSVTVPGSHKLGLCCRDGTWVSKG